MPYWDVYNPITVWSYARSTGYGWWWLARMTVWNMINNWSILSDAVTYSTTAARWQSSWWSINITVSWLLSWAWIYQANGWIYSNYRQYAWWWWRIAIKYWSVENLEVLKTNVETKWPWNRAWWWTVYLKDNTTSIDYLLVKDDWGWYGAWVWTWYDDYYFDTIEVINWWKLSIIWSEEIAASNCIAWGSPVWVIDSNIICDWTTSYRYYDLIVSIQNYQIKDRKYDYNIEWPEWWALSIWSTNWVLNWNWTISSKIKLSKLWTYTITFNLYDWNSEESEIQKTVIKNVLVSVE